MPVDVVADAIGRVQVGEPFSDTTTVNGTVPDGSTLVFAVFRQADPTIPVCDESTLVADTSDRPVLVDGPGAYTSPTVALDQPGAYAWVETLLVGGDVRHTGACGAEHETTTVAAPPAPTPTPTPPATPTPSPSAPSTTPAPILSATPPAAPPTPPELAQTGAGSTVALGIAGVWLLFIGAALLLVRRLARARQHAADRGDGRRSEDDGEAPSL